MEPFSEELDVLLIHTVEQHPVLYDPEHPKYSDGALREKSWKKVAAVVKKPSKMCKTRWINMRDALRRKVMHERKQCGKSKRQYKYEDRMDFVKKHFKDVVYYLRDDETNDDSRNKNESSELVVVKESLDSDFEFGDADATFEFKNVHSSRDSLNDNEYVQQNNTALITRHPGGAIEPFLASIGATLRQLTPYYLNQAKTKIFQVVQEYELAQIIEKDGHPSTSSV